MIRTTAMVALGILFAAAGAAEAQNPRRQARDTVSAERRAAIQRQLRERIAVVVKQRLQLTDAQASQLQEAEQRFGARRRELMQRELRVRQELRQQLMPGVAADQQRVASLLDQIIAVHRDRVAVIQEEQQQLARFLTPVQRAQYLGLQNQLRQRIEGMRRGQGRRAGPPGAARRRPSGRPPRP